jgi:Phage virion morphogenesis family
MSPITGVFEIGDTGESFVITEWVPDPKLIAAQLLRLSNDLDNFKEPLEAAKEAFIYDTSLHFETEFDPYGRTWTPLEASYLKRKIREGHEGNILHAEGTLEETATSQQAWIVTERDILFNFAAVPFYGPYHQAGTMDAGIQEIVSKLRSGQELTRAEVGVSISSSGRGKSLPQRMFIGADEPTIDEIEQIFLDWLDKEVERDWSHGPVDIYGSNVLGTFPIMSFFGGQPILRTPSGPRFGRL